MKPKYAQGGTCARASRPFTLKFVGDNRVERDCPTCRVPSGTGRVTINADEGQICFAWTRVTYPASGCFKVVQIAVNRFRLRGVDVGHTIDYAVTP